MRMKCASLTLKIPSLCLMILNRQISKYLKGNLIPTSSILNLDSNYYTPDNIMSVISYFNYEDRQLV